MMGMFTSSNSHGRLRGGGSPRAKLRNHVGGAAATAPSTGGCEPLEELTLTAALGTDWPRLDDRDDGALDGLSGGEDRTTDEEEEEEEEEAGIEDEENRINTPTSSGPGEGKDKDKDKDSEPGVLDGSCRRSARLAATRAQRRRQSSGLFPSAEPGPADRDDRPPPRSVRETAVAEAYSFEGEEDWASDASAGTPPAPTPGRRHSVDASAGTPSRAPAGDARRRTICAPSGPHLKSSLKSGPRGAAESHCSFSSVDVREHERIAGDNPCVRKGVPLAIGWGYLQHESIGLDEFESHRGPPRTKGEMVVPSAVRERILREEHGVEVDDIIASLREVARTQKQRRRTEGAEPLAGLAELGQSARRKLRRLVGRTSTAKEERKLWAGARRHALKEHLRARIEADAQRSALKRVPSDEEARARRCTFSSVDVREHERIAGDNPCVRHGVPLALGWGYRQHESIGLDEFEAHRGPPRAKGEMVVPSAVREQILREEHCVPVDDIIAALREVALAKKQRRHTVDCEALEGLAELGQSARRKVKRLVGRASTAEDDKEMWAQAHHSALSEGVTARAH